MSQMTMNSQDHGGWVMFRLSQHVLNCLKLIFHEASNMLDFAKMKTSDDSK